MSFFNTTATLQHRTPLPLTATLAQAVSLLHNHDRCIRSDPELAHYEEITPSASSSTKIYKITDNMHTLPRGLWDTTVSFTAEMTDLEDGLQWVIKAPLGLVQNSSWRVLPAEEQDKVGEPATTLVVVEEVEIRASRLLVGTVKGKCESNWKGIHQQYLEQLKAMASE